MFMIGSQLPDIVDLERADMLPTMERYGALQKMF